MKFPNIWKVKKIHGSSHHQPLKIDLSAVPRVPPRDPKGPRTLCMSWVHFTPTVVAGKPADISGDSQRSPEIPKGMLCEFRSSPNRIEVELT